MQEEKRFHSQTDHIDFLAGIAILMVIMVHSAQPYDSINATVRINYNLWTNGMPAFFLIDGI